MKKITFPVAIAVTLLLSAFTSYTALTWKISKGYAIKFSSDNPSGVFTKLDGTIAFDEANLSASKFEVSIDAASISTGNGMKNAHAKSKDWFDVKTYPSITFKSSKVSKFSKNYEMTGTLNLHGVQKEITFPFTFANNTFAANFEVNRLDYKIGTDKGMSGKASKIMKIEVSVPVSN